MAKKASAEATAGNIRRRTSRKYSAEEKMRIVLEGLGGDQTIADSVDPNDRLGTLHASVKHSLLSFYNKRATAQVPAPGVQGSPITSHFRRISPGTPLRFGEGGRVRRPDWTAARGS